MKNLRTFVFLFLALALAVSLFCLVSCGGGEEESEEKITVTFIKSGSVYKTVRDDADGIADIDLSSEPMSSPVGYGFDET